MKKSSLTSASNGFNDRNKKSEFKPEISPKKSRFIFLFPVIGIMVIIYLIFFSPEKYNIDQVILNSEDVLVLKENMLPVNGFLSSDRDAKISEGKYQNGLPHGNHVLYAESYTTKTEYKSGLKNGLEISHYTNGQLRSRINYVDGKLSDGLYEIWNSDGQIKERGEILDGNFVGQHNKWASNGNLIYKGNYKDGKLDGNEKEWDDDGNIISNLYYKDGFRDGKSEIFSRGEKKYEYNHKLGKLDGKYTRWSYNGVKILESYYIDGEINGLTRAWTNDGVLIFNDDVNIVRTKYSWIIIKNNRKIIEFANILLAGGRTLDRKTALAAARDFEHGGYNDWRLPTTSEVKYFYPISLFSSLNGSANNWTSTYKVDSKYRTSNPYKHQQLYYKFRNARVKKYDGWDMPSEYSVSRAVRN